MATSISGGCACGAVRYEFSGEPMFAANCHCRDCQRASGSPFASFFALPQAAVRVTGEVKYHAVTSEAGNTVSRGFCPACGSRLMGRTTLMPDAMVIVAGSLDDPSWFKPAMNVWTASAQAWDHMSPELPAFPKNPPM